MCHSFFACKAYYYYGTSLTELQFTLDYKFILFTEVY